MEIEDVKGLSLAYLGCFILTIGFIYYFESGFDNSIFDLILNLTIARFGIIVFIQSKDWVKASKKIYLNFKKKLK